MQDININPFNVLLTPIPSMIYLRNGKHIARINVIVSIKQYNGAATQQINMLEFHNASGFIHFPEWITQVVHRIGFTFPATSALAGANFQLTPNASDPSSLLHFWSLLWTPMTTGDFTKKFVFGSQDPGQYDLQKLNDLLDANDSNMNLWAGIINRLTRAIDLSDNEIQRLTKRQPKWEKIIRQFKERRKILREEIDYHSKQLTDEEMRTFGADIQKFTDQERQLSAQKKNEQAKIDRLKKAQEENKKQRGIHQSNHDQGKRLQNDLKNIADNHGIVPINQQPGIDIATAVDQKRKADGLENANGTTARTNPRTDNTVGYTADFDQPSVMYLNDLLGYCNNYEPLRRKLGLLWTFEAELSSDQSNRLSPERDVIAISNLPNLSSTAFQYDVLRPVMYEIGKYSTQSSEDAWFLLPAKENEPLFENGFLKLKSTWNDETKTPRFELLQNNPQQGGLARKTLSDYSNGFYLVQNYTTEAIVKSMSDPGPTLYLENLIAGYRVDIRLTKKWKSLHQYNATLKIGNDTEKFSTEGWISRDTVVEVKPRVFVVPDEQSGIAPAEALNTSRMKKDVIYRLVNINSDQRGDKNITRQGIDLGQYAPLEYYVTISDSTPKSKGNNITLTQTTQETTSQANINANNDLLAAWYVEGKSIASNNSGEVYYTSITVRKKNAKEFKASASAFLPTSLVCHISGNSLSAPIVIGERLREEYKSRNTSLQASLASVTGSLTLQTYLAACAISLSDMAPVTKSLPPLRMNKSYDVRCRLVCIDGTSLPLNAECADDASICASYLRQESVSAPKIINIARPKPIPGTPVEQIKQIQFRTQFNKEKQVIIFHEKSTSSATYQSTVEQRLIAPPGVTWQLSEWLGVFDNPHAINAERLKSYTDNYMPAIAPDSTVSNRWYWISERGKFEETVSAVTKRIPYLADPWAFGVVIVPSVRNRQAIRQQRPVMATFFEGPFDQTRVHPILLEITGKVGEGISLASAANKITITIGEGEDVELLIQSIPWPIEKTALQQEHFYFPRATQHTFSTSELPHETIAGISTFRVIHPVQDPMQIPKRRCYPAFFTGVKNGHRITLKALQDADVPVKRNFETSLIYPGKTSSIFQLFAQWTDVEDDLKPRSGPFLPIRFNTRTVKVCDLLAPQELGDVIRSAMKNITQPELAGHYIPDSDKHPENAEQRIIYDDITLLNRSFEHTFPDTRWRICRYWLLVNNRFENYFQAETAVQKQQFADTAVEADSFEQNKIYKSSWDEVDVTSTAPPKAPEFAYAMPAYSWSSDGRLNIASNMPAIVRLNTIIRVYFKRPWFSSGMDEQVAIICAPRNLHYATLPGDNSPELQKCLPFVSTWGKDITVDGNSLSLMNVDHIANTTNKPNQRFAINTPLISDANKRLFEVAIFDIAFDYSQNLWFADIELDMRSIASYSPFVRLALARYQKNSLPDMELSDAVITDFIPLQTERTLTVNSNAPTNYIFTLDSGISANPSFKTKVTLDIYQQPQLKLTNSEKEILTTAPAESYELEFTGSNYYASVPRSKITDKTVIAIREYEVYENGKGPSRLVYGDVVFK